VGSLNIRHLLVILGGGLILFGYQNCSKINVRDPFVAGVAGDEAAQQMPVLPDSSGAGDGVVATDLHGDMVNTQVEHPASSPVSEPPPALEPPSSSNSNPPLDLPKAPPSSDDDSKNDSDSSQACGHDKKDFDVAVDVDQYRNKEVKLNLNSKKKTLVYCSSGKGHVKEINTGDSPGEVVVCNTDVEVLKGKKGKVKLTKSKVKSKDEFKGSCHDDDNDHDDREGTSHDNRDHDFADNSNRNHTKEKIGAGALNKNM
jgi:hypothetical protein